MRTYCAGRLQRTPFVRLYPDLQGQPGWNCTSLRHRHHFTPLFMDRFVALFDGQTAVEIQVESDCGPAYGPQCAVYQIGQ